MPLALSRLRGWCIDLLLSLRMVVVRFIQQNVAIFRLVFWNRLAATGDCDVPTLLFYLWPNAFVSSSVLWRIFKLLTVL